MVPVTNPNICMGIGTKKGTSIINTLEMTIPLKTLPDKRKAKEKQYEKSLTIFMGAITGGGVINFLKYPLTPAF